MNVNKKQSMSENEKWSVNENEEQSMSDKWSMNDEYLETICAYSIKLILCIPWVTTFLPLSIPTKF